MRDKFMVHHHFNRSCSSASHVIPSQVNPIVPWLLLMLLVLGPVTVSRAQALSWQTAKANAMALAKSQNKLVLLMAGRHTCGNCNHMQNTVCETTSPPIKQLIQGEFVPWFCVVDDSAEWYAYASGLGSFTLPLICCIDPDNPDRYLDRTTGIQQTPDFYNRLSQLAAAQGPKILPGQCRFSRDQIRLSMVNLRPGRSHALECSTDFKTWQTIQIFVCTNRTATRFEPNPGRGRAYYRVRTR